LKELQDLRFGCTQLGIGEEGQRFATVAGGEAEDPGLHGAGGRAGGEFPE